LVSKITVYEHNFLPLQFDYIPNRYFQNGTDVDVFSQVMLREGCDASVEIAADSSALRVDKAGRYPIVYTAADQHGNSVSVTAYIAITNAPLDTVISSADRILSGIIRDDMTEREKAKAIFDWVRRSIRYVDTSEKGDPVSGAMTAFNRGMGDCYIFYSITEILLTRAGIKNICVTRIGGTSRHYWHLIDVGDGWYHLDTSPHFVPMDSFMFTDQAAAKYTTLVGRSYYTYDKSVFERFDIK
jgi:hypothetical protein